MSFKFKPTVPLVQNEPSVDTGIVKTADTKPVEKSGTVTKGFKFVPTKTATSTPVKEEPYFAGSTPEGATFGPSPILDTSGKPLFDYRNPGDKATTTDKTRVAVKHDPRVAQVQNSKDFYNPRAIANRAELKKSMGGSYDEQLDHIIALELSGSNQPENLQIEDGINGTSKTATDPLENQLARDVANGKKSLFDAQTELAQAKGKPTPWTGKPTSKKSTGFSDFISKIKNVWSKDVAPAIESVVGRPEDNMEQNIATQSYSIDKTTGHKIYPTVEVPRQNLFKDTFKQIPSKLIENPFATFGAGSVIKEFRDNPQNVDNLKKMTATDYGKSVLTGSRDFLKGFVSPVLDAAGAVMHEKSFGYLPSQIHFNIPGLGEFSNVQYNSAQRILAGEPKSVVLADEVVTSVFDLMFLAGIAQTAFSPRSAVTSRFQGEIPSSVIRENQIGGTSIIKSGERNVVDNGPKSFREYKVPQTTKSLSPYEVARMEEQGVKMGPDFDPSLPTFFRIKGTGKGSNVSGEIVQLKPSYIDLAINKLGKIKANSSFFKSKVEKAPSMNPDEAISSGQIPKDSVYKPDGKTLTPEFAKQRVDEVAKGLDQFKIGLGAELANNIDVENVTIPEIINKGVEILDKPENVGISKNPEIANEIISQNLNTLPPGAVTKVYGKVIDTNVVTESIKNPEAPTVKPELQKEANKDWKDNYSKEYGKLSEESLNITSKIGESTGKDTLKLNNQLAEIASKQAILEKDFVEKWTEPKLPNELSTEINQNTENGIASMKERITIEDYIDGIIDGIDNDTFTADRLLAIRNNLDKMDLKSLSVNLSNTIESIDADRFTEENIQGLQRFIDTILRKQEKKLPPKPLSDIKPDDFTGGADYAKAMIKAGDTRTKAKLVNEWVDNRYKKTDTKITQKDVVKKPAKTVKKEENEKLKFDDEVYEWDKKDLKKAGIGVEAMGFDEHATVLQINGVPALGYSMLNGDLAGLSIAKQFRKQGIATRFLNELLDENDGKLGVIDANSDMLAVLNKIGDVSEPNGEGIVMVTREIKTPIERFLKKYVDGHGYPSIRGLKHYMSVNKPTELDDNEIIKKYKELYPDLLGDDEVSKEISKSSVKKEKPSNSVVTDLEQDLQEFYRQSGPASIEGFTKADEALDSIMSELQLSKAGSRLMTGYGNDFEVKAIPSTFPEWIPEQYRTSKIIGSVTKYIDKGAEKISYPTGNKPAQRAFVDAILDMVDERAGVNTKLIRNKILKQYEKESQEVEKVNDQGAKGVSDEQFNEELAKQWQTGGNSGGNASDIGIFRDGTPIELGSMDKIHPIEMPEMVRLARELSGKAPKIKVQIGRKVGTKGIFKSADGEIELRADIFADPEQAAKTLAHEIGHLMDWIPDKTLARGNLIGRVNSLRKFMLGTFETADGGVIVDKVLRNELIAVSEYWRPYYKTTATETFLKYRNSGKELYADAISMLLNTPGTLEKMAPTFWKEFFNALDSKPDVKADYFELQELLNGSSEAIFKARKEDIRKGFARAEDIQKGFAAKKKLSIKSVWERLRSQLDDINYYTLKKQKEYEATGAIIPEEDNVKFLLEEQSYADNENFLMVDQIDREIVKPIEKAGMTMEDFGEYLLLDRIRNDRADIANPFGFNQKNSTKQLEVLKNSIGEDNFQLLEDKVKEFHGIVFKSVEEAVAVGSYNKETFETRIKPNKNTYASFQVVDYMQEFMPAGIKAQVGTLKEVANPFISTILKTISLNRLNSFQRAKRATVKLLMDGFPDEISKTKTITTDGKLSVFKPGKDRGQLEMLEDGKLVSYDVDPYIAESFNKTKVGDLNIIVSLIDKFNNKLFKPLVTTYNLGFAAGFNPIRDFTRNYKMIPNATVAKLLTEYVKSLPSAIKYSKGELNEFTRSLVESKAINAPINDYNFDARDDELGRIMQKYHLVRENPDNLFGNATATKITKIVLKPIVSTLEGIRFVANTFEIVSKIAGAQVRLSGGETGKQLAYNLRNYTGTPNYKVRGSQTQTTNAIFVFSNIMKEGLKSEARFATDPKTRSGYWWKTVKINHMPKLLMLLASSGVLGLELKKFFDKVSEYDKTNYLIIPLGTNEDGKAVYARIPPDEVGRLQTAVFWKLANTALDGGKVKDFQDIFALASGQLPSITPVVTIFGGWTQYLSGRNPYDAFRGRNVIDDTTWEAGGGAAMKKMVKWTANEVGLSKFTTFDTSKNTGVETFMQVAPWFSTILKISDYGLQEKINEVKAETKSKEAQTTLSERTLVDKYVKIAKENNANMFSYSKYDVQLIKEALGGHLPTNEDEQAISDRLKVKFKRQMKRGIADDPRVVSIIDATTNKQRTEIIKSIKADMTPEEFATFKKGLIEDNVVKSALLLGL